jgi:glycosyltransferase involved in cell wall biosynthesis
MKLLIITQSVDRKSFVPLLFFVEWLREFGKQCERVTVIAQRVGEYDLPENVHIKSLKKEEGLPVWRQILRAWGFMCSERKNYDAVLVHMTPIWVVLGAPVWLILGKRMYLWYEARGTKWHTHLAVLIVRKIFSASEGGLPIKTKKNVITGHGIDVDFFSFGNGERDSHLLMTLGRHTKAKRLDHILHAFAKLPTEYRLLNIGAMITEKDTKTVEDLKKLAGELGVSDRVDFRTVSDEELRDLLQRANVLLHASERTSLDKAVLQAMACGCLVVTSSPVVKPCVPAICRADSGTMQEVTEKLLAASSEEQGGMRSELRKNVVQNHSLPSLIERLVGEMS